MEKFKRFKLSSDEPIISLRDNKFHYNSILSRLAELKDKEYLVYHYDIEKRQIGFEFLSERTDEHAYRLIRETGRGKNFRSSAGELIARFSWVKAIHDLDDNELKKFIVSKKGNLWIISFKPAFEHKISRADLNKIPNGTKGIYKYIDSHDEIVYIGKGDIKVRAKESKRDEWKFIKIEYSIINDESKQFEWEDFWIDWFKENNNERLPYYNKITGNKTKSLSFE